MASRLKFPKPKSRTEETFARDMRALKFPECVREHVFAPPRRWRFDFAWPERKVAVEIEGLTRPGTKSRHTTNAGYTSDAEKYNRATQRGWQVLRFTQQHVKSGYALEITAEVLGLVIFTQRR